jgi:hypothetical protein
MESRRLLVIDNDFEKHASPEALQSAIEKVREKHGIHWEYEVCDQRTGCEKMMEKDNGYNAVMIDNDLGFGMGTLNRVLNRRKPIAFASLFPFGELCFQWFQQKERGAFRQFKGEEIGPEDFQEHHISYIPKTTKTTGGEYFEQFAESLYCFLYVHS